ncbi:hypothetical protein EYC80_003175 [Monilinia laxa]|uniref:Uncharacterized protein n=1 Tax=Monilinia laxa TaxID=61186 RepID=A0A5N6KCX3_MONLA|nr:hypothetical protein EYC80_003175 [Monilinia laxa]
MPLQFLDHKLTPKGSLTKIYRNKNFNESDITVVSTGERKQPTNITTCSCTPKIGFTATPQYSYTNAECRLWIAAQLRVYCFFLPRSAITAIADKFVGSGQKMFAMEREVWIEDILDITKAISSRKNLGISNKSTTGVFNV